MRKISFSFLSVHQQKYYGKKLKSRIETTIENIKPWDRCYFLYHEKLCCTDCFNLFDLLGFGSPATQLLLEVSTVKKGTPHILFVWYISTRGQILSPWLGDKVDFGIGLRSTLIYIVCPCVGVDTEVDIRCGHIVNSGIGSHTPCLLVLYSYIHYTSAFFP